MDMNLRCPKCGFAFGVYCDDDITEEEKTELMTCPCGTLMEQTEELRGIVLEVGRCLSQNLYEASWQPSWQKSSC